MTNIEDVLESSNGECGLLVRAVRGFFPSTVALGLTRAWLSFQTGVCLSYGTSFVLRDGLDAVQPAALVFLSLLLVAERNPQAMPVVGGWFHPAGFG